MTWILRVCLVIGGSILLTSCNQKGQFYNCPPFPEPHPQVKYELQFINDENHPYFVDWMNRLYKLKRQLEERKKTF